MRKILLACVLVMMSLVTIAMPINISSVEAHQHCPWNGQVDVTVVIQGAAEDVANADCLFTAINNATKAAIPIKHIMRNGNDEVSNGVVTRKFIWYVKTDVGEVKIDDVVLTVDAKILGGVQLWENGPYWAECNVGATKPEEAGYYFWWGDTVGYKRNSANNGWASIKDGSSFSFSSDNCPTYGADISQLQSMGYIDATGNLVAKCDAATAHLGAPWRMPTDAEFSALISNCTTTWTTCNGVAGRLVTGKGAYSSKSIFLPASGDGSGLDLSLFGLNGEYWLSTMPDSSYGARCWLFNSSYSDLLGAVNRCYGMSVRPVRGVVDAAGPLTDTGVATHFAWNPPALKVSSVEARQRYPWDGLVDITVTIQGAAEDVAEAGCVFFATNISTEVAIPVTHIIRNGDDTMSNDTVTRKFIWDAKADVGEVKIDDVALTADLSVGGIQLWENGPYWAECNVGATKPEEAGYYFWWGDTAGYKRNSANNGWVSIKDGSSFSFSSDNCPTYGENDSSLQSAGYIDATGNLVAAHDAATAHLGAPWRMPTNKEMEALVRNCTTTWTTRNGVAGRLVAGKGAYASKSIFLPAAGDVNNSYLSDLGSYGYYWSSSPTSGTSYGSDYLYFYSSRFSRNYGSRSGGRSVRPVRGFANMSGSMATSDSAVTTHLSLDCRVGAKVADSLHPLVYDAAWHADGATAKILANGQEIVSGAAGSYAWVPAADGAYLLTLKVYDSTGNIVGEETAWYLRRENLSELVIPEGTTEIGDYAFAGGAFTSVTIPSSVANIAATAFAGCTKLSNVVLHGGVSVLRQKVPEVVEGTMWIEETEVLDEDKVYRSNPIGFNQSTAIEFAIPKGLEQVAFSWKVGSEQNYDWLTWYFDGVQQGRISGSRDWESITKDLDGEAHVLKFVYSEDNVVSVAPDCGWVSVHASGGCISTLIDLFPDSPIAVVTIGDEIAEVPDAFFANCTAMETVVLSGAVTNIGADAFLGCEKLNRVDVASLGDWLKIEFANEMANPLYYGAELYAGGVKVQGYSRLLSPIFYENLCGATHTNPASYQEGIPVVLMPPKERTGYAFTGWTPDGITAKMSGEQTVIAGWRANTYKIEYDANGGMGMMATTDCEYDKEQVLVSNQFVRVGHVFVGWAIVEDGASVVEDGATVKNLSSTDGAVVRLYAVWEIEHIETPVIMPKDGTVFKDNSCMVTITCGTEGATIYYTTGGRTPRMKSEFKYNGPFEIMDTETIVAVAFKDGNQSEYAEVMITHIDPAQLTLASVLGEPKLYDVATGGDGEWVSVVDDAGKLIKTSALSGALIEDDKGTEQGSWLEAKVYGKGTLTFWWRVNCEPDPRSGKFTYDYAAFEADDELVARRDGITEGWEQVTKTFDTDGEHVLRWSYNTDGYLTIDGEYEGCVWVNGVTWSGSSAPEEPSKPTIEGDENATVTGDAEMGFVVRPSEGKTAVEVSIPQGVDATKVTVEVSPKVVSVKPNGAKVKIVSGGADITEFLNMPVADGSGVIDLSQAEVKVEIVEAVLDPEEGAKVELNAENPTLTTSPTIPGLTYSFREASTLEGFGAKLPAATKVGDGEPWTPPISVKGGQSAFYSISVGK